MVKFLRVLGREPLRSASRCLGFTIVRYWGLGARLSAGPAPVPRRPQDPIDDPRSLNLLASVAPLATVYPRDAVTAGSTCTTRSLSEGCA